MKKKIFSIITAVAMVIGLMPLGAITAFADHTHTFTSGVFKDNGDGTHSQKCIGCDVYGMPNQVEVLQYTNTEFLFDYSYTGTNFKVTARSADHHGMEGGMNQAPLKIEALYPSAIITGIDAVVDLYGEFYGGVKVSSGVKLEKDGVPNGTTVHVRDINANTFTFFGGEYSVQIKDITIYYTIDFAAHSFTSDVYKDNGNGTHSIKCSDCDAYGVSGQTEILQYTNAEEVIGYSFTGTDFTVSTGMADRLGMFVGDYGGFELKIESLNPTIIITDIDAVVGFFGENYGKIRTSSGDKLEKTGVHDGTTVHVTGINAKNFSFSSEEYARVQFKDITIHYIKYPPHNFTGDVYKDNGNGTHIWKCTYCDACSMPEQTEILPYTNTENIGGYSFTGKDFRVVARSADGDGMYGGTDFFHMRIETLDPTILITGVDAVIGYYGGAYGGVGISSGEKVEKGEVSRFSTVHVTGINADTFLFSGGSSYVQFKDITVHYIKSDPHSFTSGVYKDNGDGTHSQKCVKCDAYGMPVQVEVFPYTNAYVIDNYSFTGTKFKITSTSANSDGIYGGTDDKILQIETLDPTILITGVDAVVGLRGEAYSDVGISGGTKFEKYEVPDGTTVHITNINSSTFAFKGGNDYVQFKDITVHYMESIPHTFVYKNNGDGTHSHECISCDACILLENTNVLPYKNTEFVNYYFYTGTNFKVTAKVADGDGMYGGTDDKILKIESIDPSILITAVDAVVGYNGSSYREVGISSGEKLENDEVSNGATVHITNINSSTFAFKGGSQNAQFKDITVHYMAKAASHTFIYKDNGDGTHSQKCTVCDEYSDTVSHTFENCKCACGVTNHDFSDEYINNGDGTHSQKCTKCGEYRTTPHTFELVDNGDGTHSQKCTKCDEYGEPSAHNYRPVTKISDDPVLYTARCKDCASETDNFQIEDKSFTYTGKTTYSAVNIGETLKAGTKLQATNSRGDADLIVYINHVKVAYINAGKEWTVPQCVRCANYDTHPFSSEPMEMWFESICDYTFATCETPETCVYCGHTKGAALGHQWQDATIYSPKTCLVCGKTEGEPVGGWDKVIVTSGATEDELDMLALTDKTVVVFEAEYNQDGIMIQAGYKNLELKSNETYKYKIDFNKYTHGNKVAVYVWNNLIDIKPSCEFLEFEVK